MLNLQPNYDEFSFKAMLAELDAREEPISEEEAMAIIKHIIPQMDLDREDYIEHNAELFQKFVFTVARDLPDIPDET
jgi:hypothetical protein